MALIGEMQYLTIGGSTYSIPTGTTVEVERNLTSGTKSATIKIDGTSYDLYAPTPNAGTVTSVRVQATSPVQSSTSTAQSSSLNTTISLANGYGDTKNPYGTKTKNYVLAGPTTGSDAAPTFRALVAADIPDLSGTYLTSYTETDPVYSASAASGITSSDISNWNNKVSDDKTWNGVTLNKSVTTVTSDLYIPCTISTSSTAAYLIKALDSSYSGGSIARRTSAGYLVAQTPSANDNSTKVATTAYVDAAIPDVSGFSTTDEKLKINAVSDTEVYYPIFGSNSTSNASTQLYDNNFKYQSATWATLTLGSYNGKKGNWQIFNGSYYIDLQPATLTSARTIYFPDKAGTVALTSDIPDTSGFVSKSGDTMTGNLAFADGKGITLNYDGQTDTLRLIGYGSNFRVANFSTQTILRNIYTPDSDTAAANKKYVDDSIGAISIPTKTSDLTNDSGFITSFTDENVKSTAVTAATTYYLTGSTSSSTATGGLSKHAAIKAYVTANSGTGGSARIDLGNTTATTSAGGKEGIIRLYGTSATYYVELKAGAPSANRTINFPNKGGTVALTSDIPTVSYPVTSVNNKTGAVSLSASDVGALPSTTAIPSKTSDLTNDSGFLTSYTETDPTVPSWAKASSKPSYTAAEVGAMSTSHAANAITSTDISNWNAKSDTDEKVKQSRYNLINENRSILVSSVNLDGAGETVTAETYGCSYLVFNNYSQTLKITGSAGQGVLSLASDKISYQKSNYSTSILFANQTADTTLTLPNETGIVALTSDIPTVPTNVSAFTNDSGYAVINNTTVTLTTAGWNNNSQSVTVTGVTASNSVIVTATAASESTYLSCGVKCSSQAANTLTFTCTTTPTAAIDVNVIVLTGN